MGFKIAELKNKHQLTIMEPQYVVSTKGSPMVAFQRMKNKHIFVGFVEPGNVVYPVGYLTAIGDAEVTLDDIADNEPKLKNWTQRDVHWQWLLAHGDVESRVKFMLSWIHERGGGISHPEGRQVSITRETLSRMCGCSREMVGRVITKLIAYNQISVEGTGHTFLLRDEEYAKV